MAVIVQDLPPRQRFTAIAGQTVFGFNFLIFDPTDINVYVTPLNTAPNDVTNILQYNVGYTVVIFAAPTVGGTITLAVAAAAGDIVTLVRNQPDNRLDNYIDGGPFTAEMTNTDFDRTVLMAQQNKMYDQAVGVHYNLTAPVVPVVDTVLPILGANQFWVKNNANDAIIAAGNAAPYIPLPTVANKIAYFTSTTGLLGSTLFSLPAADSTLGNALVTNGAGILNFTSIPGKNLLINGNFQSWQRGTTVTVPANTTQYTVDCWQLQTGAVQQCDVGRLVTGGVGIQRQNGQTGITPILFCQSLTIDNCYYVAGGPLTISFQATAGATFSPVNQLVTLTIYGGTGAANISGINGAFTGSTLLLNGTFQVAAGGNFAYYAFPFPNNVPANITQLAVQFSWTPVGAAGATDILAFTNVQLERSPYPTPFEYLDLSQQLIRCQRFFQKSFRYSVAPASGLNAYNGAAIFTAQAIDAAVNNGSCQVPFKTVMLNSTPTITYYNPSANANGNFYNYRQNVDMTAPGTIAVSDSGFWPQYTGAVGTLVGDSIAVQWTASCELT